MVAEMLRKSGAERRQALIEIKEALREDGRKEIRTKLISEIKEQEEAVLALFSDHDPKVRKNLALVLGELAIPKYRDILWNHYKEEKTLFVRSSYLQALKKYDTGLLLEDMKAVMEKLMATEQTEENRKHLQEEKKYLRELIGKNESNKPHIFCGEGIVSDLILTTNRNQKHVVLEQIPGEKKRTFSAGLMVQTKHPQKILQIRTFEEMFFVLPGGFSVDAMPQKAARQLSDAGICEYLSRRHQDNGNPFVFRIDLRADMPLDKRSVFTMRMASELEALTHGRMVNSVHDYEVEIRLVSNKEGGFYAMLKLLTIKDYRFAYRRETIAAGMRPVNAALCMALAEDYLSEQARVLDPFCGAGTMLVERAKVHPVREMYGLDILADAITKARENTKLSGEKANYINRDFFTFTHERTFDEIVTDMPFTNSDSAEKKKEIAALYRDFFCRLPEILSEKAVLVIYTHDRELLKKNAAGAFTLEKEYEISMKEGSYLFILSYER